jgi:ribose 5-phosphate isomerase A
MADVNSLKQQAAEAAVEMVQSGMKLGLGHGSTVQFALERLSAKIKSSELTAIIGIPSSKHTKAESKRLGIPLGDLRDFPEGLDLDLDGADEVDPQLNLIKGGGGALLRERIVAVHCKRVVIMVDESKLVNNLGTKHDLPIVVSPSGWESHLNFIAALGGKAKLRTDQNGKPVVTDEDYYLLDCKFGEIDNPEGLAAALENHEGIVDHGLFLGLATDVIVAGASGIQRLVRNAG